MDWFEALTGFREGRYDSTRAKLAVAGGRLRSLVNGRSFAIGEFEIVSLADLRRRASAGAGLPGRLSTAVVRGDVRRMHLAPENARALFQVASQFNCLEMASPEVTPEHGVARYQHDRTQGPACAIAAGAATIYRNYFVPLPGGSGQTADRQIDTLAEMGAALSRALGLTVGELWDMRNGYALCSGPGLDAIAAHLAALDDSGRDSLRATLRVGVHWGAEATEAAGSDPLLVSQAFCSALPVSYGRPATARWEAFARLVLEAAYEATVLAAALNAQRGASNRLFLTLLGGGAFGNPEPWITSAMRRALRIAASYNLDVRLVSYGAPSSAMERIAADLK